MQINLYTISKRKNSTALPTGSAYTITCVLKENTDVLSPSFLLQDKPTLAYNYLEWQGLYYWINDITYETNNLWRIDCSIDVLASFRDAIHAGKAYIEYSSAYDSRIPDPRPSKKTNPNVLISTGATYTNYSPDSGSIVMCASGSETSGCYVLNADPSDIIGDLYQWWNNFDTSDIQHSLKNLALYVVSGDVSQNIRSLIWMPWTITGGTSSPIFLGMYDTGKTGSRINMYSRSGFTTSISIPQPNIANWRIQSGYCEYVLYLPLIGQIALSTDILNGQSSVIVQGSLDETTGDISVEVYTNGGNRIGVYGASTGANIPIGGAGFTPRTAMTGLIAGVGAVVTGGALGAGLIGAETGGAVLATEMGGLLSVTPSATCVGGAQGKSASGLTGQPKIVCTYWDLSDDNSRFYDTIGCPTFKVDTIGNYTYVRGSQVSLPISCYGSILEMINRDIQGGVFIE